ncbi:MAG: hypothetical protein ACTSXE_02690 [Candidatus Thorarchaeota archaeon]
MEVVTTAKSELGDRTVTVEYDFGGSLDEAVEKFGAEVVFSNFVRQAKVGLQAIVRSNAKQLNEAGTEYAKSDDEVIAALASWSPSDGTVNRVSKSDKLDKILGTMGEEERAEFLAKYMS